MKTRVLYSIQNGWTPLMIASFEGHVDIVRTLIKAKAQINTQEKVHCTLHTLQSILHVLIALLKII